MKSIALYSIKGGVGKTAAAVNLSYLTSLSAPPCLICDLDPQGASSYYFRITASKKYDSDKFLKGSKKIYSNIKATDFENLDLLPSDFSYRNLDIELSEEKKPQKKLKKNLESLSDDYSHVFFDCPPNLTLLSESVFSASDIILVPMIPTTLSIRTYNQLIDFFAANNLDRSRIRAFFTMVEKRKAMHRDIIARYGDAPGFLRQTIPYNSEVEKMGVYRAPLTAVKPNSIAAKAYKGLFEELMGEKGL
ncbi:ParA family protein [Chlorobium phaeovibrioides]|uniref:AAA family ATPase n=2 Tax=Chlorobium phaeovibrioides TaxID=1094 RepID=A0A3S0NKF5_CHLPH|nr:AAA family ATPase [Chlorobium phaeovibrioides]MWV54516.1 AAA family ATPase [Chlorobium phaeovibrioides]RTY37464.1 ParA family protein [Chlorobium phaeovibrioides]RTY39958.1 ParA family protein [Chlorobium phaeovibrioides]HCD35439.1 cobyrinic acid a,c-diamide synthase [Chlorobium sp.]